MTFFTDTTMTEYASNLTSPTNPIYFTMIAQLQSQTNIKDGGTAHGSGSGDAFILLCNATTYDATYTWVSGAINTTMLTRSNTTLANIINSPQMNVAGFGIAQFLNGAIVAGFSNTTQNLADKLALVYSQTALGLAAGVFAPEINIGERSRTGFLVARVPFAPLYTLVFLNIIYLVGGIAGGLVARNASIRSQEVRETQVRLSVWGLGAHGFEKQDGRKIDTVEDLFEEGKECHGGQPKVVGLEKVEAEDSALRYRTWNQI
jgi:hypothetical protein